MTHSPEWKDSGAGLGSSTLREKWHQFRLWLHRGLSAGVDSASAFCLVRVQMNTWKLLSTTGTVLSQSSLDVTFTGVYCDFSPFTYTLMPWVFPEFTWMDVTVTQTLHFIHSALLPVVGMRGDIFEKDRCSIFFLKSKRKTPFLLHLFFFIPLKQLQSSHKLWSHDQEKYS